MKAKFKRFFSSIGLTKAQLITVFLSYFLCFVLFLGVVVIWDPMSKPTSEQTMVVEAATGPTNTSGWWITEGRYSIDWYTNPGSNNGTASHPYIIDSAEDLAGLSWLVYTKGQEGNPLVSGTDYSDNYIFQGKYFKQTANIDLSAYYWQPIGIWYTRDERGRKNYFSGSYDGGNHTVSGIFTPAGSTSACRYQGLFGYVESSSSSYPITIKNICITNSFILGHQLGGVVGGIGNSVGNVTITNCYNAGSVIGSSSYTGGIIGSASSNATIINCYNTGIISGSSYVGGVVGSGGSNTTIKNCYNTGAVTGSGSYVGGVVGRDYAGAAITNCYNTGAISGSSSVGGVVGTAFGTMTNSYNTGFVNGDSYVGGVVGVAQSVTIANCYNAGTVIGYNGEVGGVVGNAGSNTSITNCYYGGNCSNIGGINGEDIDDQAVYDSNIATNAKTPSWYTNSSNWNATYPWDFSAVWVLDSSVNDGFPSFKNINFVDITYWISDSSCYSIEWYTSSDKTTYGDGSATNPYKISSAEDLAGLSWLVYTKGQTGSPLKSSDYSGNYIFQGKYFKQTVDIDLSAHYWQPIGIIRTRDGTSRQNYFSGSYDGGNHTVSGIYTPARSSSAYSYQGLFGYVSSSNSSYPTTIQNIGIANSFIQGYQYVGGVVGYIGLGSISTKTANVSIKNCYNYGTIQGYELATGGIVGYVALNYGSFTLDRCFNEGEIKNFATDESSAGGIIGKTSCGVSTSTTSVIKNCYNNGLVEGVGSFCGGILGCTYQYLSSNNPITIANCYNTGEITGLRQTGGIIGYADLDPGVVTVVNSFNVGSVSSNNDKGGIVGLIANAGFLGADVYINSCYYGGKCPSTVPGVNTVSPIEGLNANYLDNIVTSAKTLSWYTTASNWNSSYPWDFKTVWALDTATNDGYPNMRNDWIGPGHYSIDWYTSAGANVGSTADNPYIIDSAEDLAGLSWLVYTKGQEINPLVDGVDYSGNYIFQGKYFKQTVDIDLSAYYWQPIGIYYTREGETRQNYFSGSYDGGNHTVSGIYTPEGSSSAYSYQGLFGGVYSSSSSYPITIKNIDVTNSFIQGYQYVGGVVGYAYASSGTITITNCLNTSSVSGSDNYVGGVVGYAYVSSGSTTITNCYNTGTVTSTATRYSYVGGVVGDAYASSSGNTTITNCYNAGSVIGSSLYTGGIIGSTGSNATIINCYNTGIISGSSYVGGVVGSGGSNTTIKNCYNTGAVTGSGSYVGGVVGSAYASSSGNTTITNCYNTGSVSASSYVGGVVGYALGATITNCYNTGSVSGSSRVGGVVGYAYGTITNCYNVGAVSGSGDYVGGVVGYAYASSSGNTTITNCYNTSSVTGFSYVGGVVGGVYASSTTGCNISKSANFGDITVTGSSGNVGGIVGYVRVTNSSYSFKMTNCYSEGSITVSGTNVTVGGFVGNLYADYSTYSNVKIEFCSVDFDIVVSGGSIASQGAFYGGTNGLTVENSYSLLTKSGTVSKVISSVSTQMDNNFGYMLNFKEGKPIPLGIFHILDVATRTGIVNRINAL